MNIKPLEEMLEHTTTSDKIGGQDEFIGLWNFGVLIESLQYGEVKLDNTNVRRVSLQHQGKPLWCGGVVNEGIENSRR